MDWPVCSPKISHGLDRDRTRVCWDESPWTNRLSRNMVLWRKLTWFIFKYLHPNRKFPLIWNMTHIVLRCTLYMKTIISSKIVVTSCKTPQYFTSDDSLPLSFSIRSFQILTTHPALVLCPGYVLEKKNGRKSKMIRQKQGFSAIEHSQPKRRYTENKKAQIR